MRSLLLLLLLAACGGAPAHSKPCEPTLVLLHATRQCGDMRSGYSGYWELEIVDGAHRGETVIAYYGDEGRSAAFAPANWAVGSPTFAPTAPQTRWTNDCLSMQQVRPTYAGAISTGVGYASESEARRAFIARRCSR